MRLLVYFRFGRRKVTGKFSFLHLLIEVLFRLNQRPLCVAFHDNFRNQTLCMFLWCLKFKWIHIHHLMLDRTIFIYIWATDTMVLRHMLRNLKKSNFFATALNNNDISYIHSFLHGI